MRREIRMRREIKRQRQRIREKYKSVTVVIFGGPNFWVYSKGKFFRVLFLTGSVLDLSTTNIRHHFCPDGTRHMIRTEQISLQLSTSTRIS